MIREYKHKGEGEAKRFRRVEELGNVTVDVFSNPSRKCSVGTAMHGAAVGVSELSTLLVGTRWTSNTQASR